LILFTLLLPLVFAYADNKVLGEIDFQGATDVEKSSGVWVDGQYLGFLKELKGSKRVLLLPGKHDIAVRQDGYQDFRTTVDVQPNEKQLVTVTLAKDTRFQMPSQTAEVKISVNPDRAAVFVDDQFVGHAGEFGGAGKGLLLAPGHRKIVVSLPGYQNFQTEVDLTPNQKFEIKTDLMKLPPSPNAVP
jgi:hypothetical protein